MEFHEISVRSKVVITVTNGSDVQAKFLSKVMKNGETHLLVIPFMYNGMRIRFEGKKMSIHMEVRDSEGILWTFRNCKIDTIRKNGLKYHKIECAMKKGIERALELGYRSVKFISDSLMVVNQLFGNPPHFRLRGWKNRQFVI